MSGTLTAAVEAGFPALLEDLHRLVRIRSVSADPAAASEVEASAAETARLLADAGLAVEILRVPGGQPAVVGHRAGPAGAPTVLLYAHHDVQPTGALENWTSDPFEPAEREGRLFARGAADDKAGIAVHLAALRAHGDSLPVSVVVLVEGEEEIGSPTLGAFLDTHRDRLAADVVVLADAANWAVGRPSLTVTLRGLADCVVEVSTLDHGVHSGLYGGAAPDALMALTRLLASLHDDDGQCAVEGLPVGPPAVLDLDADTVRTDAGVLDGVQLVGSGVLTQRLWAGPSVTVTAIDAPRVADASNTLQPTARAKISLRVPPGTDAREALQLLTDHLGKHVPWGAHLTVTPGALGEGCAVSSDGPAYAAAREAYSEAWDGTELLLQGVGGSIPFIASFAAAYPQAEILVTGMQDPATSAHGPDESLHLDDFRRACIAETLLLERLGRG